MFAAKDTGEQEQAGTTLHVAGSLQALVCQSTKFSNVYVTRFLEPAGFGTSTYKAKQTTSCTLLDLSELWQVKVLVVHG